MALSETIKVRLSPRLRERLEQKAAKERRTLSAAARIAIEKYVDEASGRPIRPQQAETLASSDHGHGANPKVEISSH